MIQKVILGIGKTGISVAEYFKKKQIEFCICDTREEPPLLTEFRQRFSEVPVYTGGFPETVLKAAEEIIISPGVPKNHPKLVQANHLIGDIELFAREVKAPVVAITGSNGKSTVTTLVGEMARNAGFKVGVGGNLGTPALDLLNLPEKMDAYILELSSFQLESTYSLKPKIATILNISPDHLDRYESFNAYIDAKKRIYSGAEKILFNRDDPSTQKFFNPTLSKNLNMSSFGLNEPSKVNEYGITQFQGTLWLTGYEQKIMPHSKLALFGRHNIANALAAFALGSAIGIPHSNLIKTLESFKGLPHRCEWVTTLHGVVWINDSKGTNVGATVAALQGLAQDISGKWLLIAGGVGKNADFSPLKPLIQQHCSALILIGEAAEELQKLCTDIVPCIRAQDMQEAVTKAAQHAKAGDGVLLSPACASLDMFKNYEERGNVFKSCIKSML